MQLAVFGCYGMLAHDIIEVFKEETLEKCDYDTCDITNNRQLAATFKNMKIIPKYAINCAAYTNVDLAEEEVSKAFDINSTGVKNLVIHSSMFNTKIVHFSTDFVFNGEKETPYVETDRPMPVNIYGSSKYEGEKMIQALSDNYLILRLSWLFGSKGNNFIKKIADQLKTQKTIKVVDDQIGIPTYTKTVADILKNSSLLQQKGIFNLVNDGAGTSRYGIAKYIAELMKSDCEIIPCSSEDFILKAIRPRNSILSNEKLKFKTQYPIQRWEDAVKDYLTEINYI
jgi:dTDP-4-dehydrorhamnose reductase